MYDVDLPPVRGDGGYAAPVMIIDDPVSGAAANPRRKSPQVDRLPPPALPSPPSGRRWRRVGAVAVAAAVFASGVGIGSGLRGEPVGSTVAAVDTTVTTAPISATAGRAVPAPGTTDADEPVAAVAESLIPTLVHLETGAGLGSGFVYDESGLILTAAHVVEGSTRVVVQFSDGSKVDGRVVGQDPASDVAVVAVVADSPLPAAPLALDDELTPGQLAVALGSPFGLEQTITAGIVSNVARPVVGDDGTVRDLIQTDAAINPGNSGGVLADRRGRVIGINDLIFSRSGGNEGVGFAIPIGYAKQIADQLVAGNDVQTARLGVGGTDPRLGAAGALITSVEAGSPAAAAGIAPGDLVIELDGEPVSSFVDLAAAVRAFQPGETIDLVVLRNGSRLVLTVDLGAR